LSSFHIWNPASFFFRASTANFEDIQAEVDRINSDLALVDKKVQQVYIVVAPIHVLAMVLLALCMPAHYREH
jgi:hypothetical protein